MRGYGRLLILSALVSALGCTSAGEGEVGDVCERGSDCLAGLGCYERSGRTPACMQRCAPAEMRVCDDGSVCTATTDGSGVCYLGGTLPLGEACAETVDCVVGAVCVEADGEARCRQACDLTMPSCVAGTACQALSNGAGYCASG